MKKTIALIFGGLGNEAEISVKSAINVANNIDTENFELILLYWHSGGLFYHLNSINEINNCDQREHVPVGQLSSLFDVALPMTHGRFGEDGVLQGLLESQRIPYAGCRVLGSALCMDKGAFKQLLSGYHIPQTKFAVLDYVHMTPEEIRLATQDALRQFSKPLFVKPANSGSSVGIVKVEQDAELGAAIREARKHDEKIIIEEGVRDAREIELAALGNQEITFSEPGELKTTGGFYDFDNKYVLQNTETLIPAPLSAKQKKDIMALAERVYRLCHCSGFARIDFFITGDKILVNEINTLPGFTDISMYPLLMQASGIVYKALLTRIIELAQ
ncbi:MAG: D-alanine--D-alanine ligase family protein [bacterium]|nr:D-alanine--D-alanine ligase family protein [bacterium]